MAFDNTITEVDLDATAKLYTRGLQENAANDASADTPSESILSRILGLLGLQRRSQ